MLHTQSPPRDISIPSFDGMTLRGWHWTRPEPRGVIVVAHGFGEHGGSYRHVAEALGPALEVELVTPDLRGHGRSPGRRGVVRRYDDLVGDVRAALKWTARERPGLPCYLLGHSNGGLLSLLLALEDAREGNGDSEVPAGLILSNPSIAIVTPIPRLKLALGRCLLYCAPGMTLAGKLDAELMTRDPAMQREHATDPLRHSRISPPLFFGMSGSGSKVLDGAGLITLPVLILLGGSDPVIDPAASSRLFDRLGSPDKVLKVYPEMLHEPLNELDRARVFADVESWLRPRLDCGISRSAAG